jgi:hypothetical protein
MNDIDHDPDILAALAKSGMKAPTVRPARPAGLTVWSGLAVMCFVTCIGTVAGAVLMQCQDSDTTCLVGQITFEMGAAISFLFASVFGVFAYSSWAKFRQGTINK